MFIDKTQLHKTEISKVSCLESVCKLLWIWQWTPGFHTRWRTYHLSQAISINVYKMFKCSAAISSLVLAHTIQRNKQEDHQLW